MSKTFAVAMMLKQPINNTQTEEWLVLHIVKDQETAGDAFLKAFDKEKNSRHKGAGCFAKVILEMDAETVVPSPDIAEFAEWCKMLPYDFIRGIGWEDPVTKTTFTTDQLWEQYTKTNSAPKPKE